MFLFSAMMHIIRLHILWMHSMTSFGLKNFCGHRRICKIHEFDLPPRILAFCHKMPQIWPLLFISIKITASTINIA